MRVITTSDYICLHLTLSLYDVENFVFIRFFMEHLRKLKPYSI